MCLEMLLLFGLFTISKSPMLRIIIFFQNCCQVSFYIGNNPVCGCYSFFLSKQPMADLQNSHNGQRRSAFRVFLVLWKVGNNIPCAIFPTLTPYTISCWWIGDSMSPDATGHLQRKRTLTMLAVMFRWWSRKMMYPLNNTHRLHPILPHRLRCDTAWRLLVF